MSDERSIGVFDSGLGGLTVVREIQRLMPQESVLYLGDTARVPYGSRSTETITRFAAADTRFLLQTDIKMLIVACNTVSSVALESVRKIAGEIPVIGVVLPGAKAAVVRTAARKIGVIGTRATIRSKAYATAIQKIDKNLKVYSRPCPLFVPLVEEGLFDSEISRQVAQMYLYEIVNRGIDCLILGCTHYPLLMETIQGTVGTRIELIDSALWTAKEAQDILTALGALAPRKRDGAASSSYFVTDIPGDFEKIAGNFLGRPLASVEKVSLGE